MTRTQIAIIVFMAAIGAMLGGMFVLPAWENVLLVGTGAAGLALGTITMAKGVVGLRRPRG